MDLNTMSLSIMLVRASFLFVKRMEGQHVVFGVPVNVSELNDWLVVDDLLVWDILVGKVKEFNGILL